MIFEYKCVVCGKQCRRKRSPANTPKNPKFCSQKCNGAYKTLNKKGPTANFHGECESCGEKFSTYRGPSNQKIKPRFCSIQCIGLAQRNEHNPAYNGGRYGCNGYVAIFDPGNSMASKKNIVLEHRLVVAHAIGRPLNNKEVVHHIDGDKKNNTLSNLIIFKNNSDHIKHHAELKRINQNG